MGAKGDGRGLGPSQLKVAISGSRSFDDWSVVERVVDRLIARHDSILVGDAPNGVDRMVAEYASNRADEIDYQEYEARWKIEGKRAGHNRNGWMVHDAEALIAIFAPGPLTPGTSDALAQAVSKGIPTASYHEGVWSGQIP